MGQKSLAILMFSTVFALPPWPARLQESSSKHADKQEEPQPPAEKKDDSTYNPYIAEHDIEVGIYYLHKGDVDAAIGRFEDAIRERPNLAKPRLLLAEAYEKKGDREQAVHYYKEYLQVLPGAPDAKKIRRKIEKLSRE
jgi:Tfp pilus assembly protein PilF